jgi:hypothetical protein
MFNCPTAVVVARTILTVAALNAAVMFLVLFPITIMAACASAVYSLGSFLITAMLDAVVGKSHQSMLWLSMGFTKRYFCVWSTKNIPMAARHVVAVVFTSATDALMVSTTVGPCRSTITDAEALVRAQAAVAAKKNFIFRDEFASLVLTQ